MFNASFNNISATSGWLVILVEKTNFLSHANDKLYYEKRTDNTIKSYHIVFHQ